MLRLLTCNATAVTYEFYGMLLMTLFLGYIIFTASELAWMYILDDFFSFCFLEIRAVRQNKQPELAWNLLAKDASVHIK